MFYKIFLLNKTDYISQCISIPKEFTFDIKQTLNSDEVKEFLELQDLAKNEIKLAINILKEESLEKILPFRAKCLLFLLVKKDSKLVGYGYSHQDPNEMKTCYINTIYIAKGNRRIGLSKMILKILIEESIKSFPHINYFKGVVHSDDDKTISLLEKFKFNDNV